MSLKITKKHYKGKVYDLIFNNTDYYYANTKDNGKFALVHNCDIDWDSELGGRDKVLEYLIYKYGQESVCNVVTYGKYKVKSALSDISRGLEKPTGLNTVLAKKIVKLQEFDDRNKFSGSLIEFFKDLRSKTEDLEILDWINTNQDTIKLSDKLIGQMKNLGTHAGGIVVTPKPIYNYIPVTRGTGNLVTAFSEADGSSKDLSELGILKLDVLGLQTLNILKGCTTGILKDKGIDLVEYINYLPFEDKNMIESFCKGDNYGVFQMEKSKAFIDAFSSAGGPVDSFEDVVAINAMNRPGPKEKYIKKYGYWKAIDQGLIKVSDAELEDVNKERYPFPFMKEILGSTYGAVLYQEQIMSLVCELTGMTFGESDVFRRSIAWTKDHPKYYTVAALFDNVKDAMLLKGYNEQDVEYFLNYLKDVSGYSFNRSHSVCYGYVAWQCLYFKTYYPVYFYNALLNQANDNEEIIQIISYAKMQNLKVKGISINKSSFDSTVEDDETIRLGYKLLKGMGDAARNEIVSLKLNECHTIHDVLQKPFKKVNSTVLGNLIDLGCFDELEPNRETVKFLFDLYKDEKIAKWFTRKRNPIDLKTMPESLSKNFEFEDVLFQAQKQFNKSNPHFYLIKTITQHLLGKEFDDKERERITLAKEKELLGFQLTISREYEQFVKQCQGKGLVTLTEAIENKKGSIVEKAYFSIENVEEGKTKTGKTYLKFLLNDGRKTYKANMWINGDSTYVINKYSKAQFGGGSFTINDFGLTFKVLEIPN